MEMFTKTGLQEVENIKKSYLVKKNIRKEKVYKLLSDIPINLRGWFMHIYMYS